ncbi:hypothetical protein [Agrococcus sp. SGAir0287]|nr:hypothetical protein [Agrococcus sp. SGAir0287]
MSDTISGSTGDPTQPDPDVSTDPETAQPETSGDDELVPEEFQSPT